MLQGNEIVMLFLGAGVWLFILINRRALQRLSHVRLLLCGYGAYTLGWLFTVLEGLIWPETINLIEHSFTGLGALLVMIWCVRVFALRSAAS